MHSWIACVVRNDHGPRGPARVEIDGKAFRWKAGHRNSYEKLYADPPRLSTARTSARVSRTTPNGNSRGLLAVPPPDQLPGTAFSLP